MYMLYVFFWVILRRLNFICRNFGTLCLSHLHRRIGMKDDIHHGLTQSGDFSTMMIKGLWLNLTKSTLLKLTPSASCNLNPTPPTEKLHIHRFFWRQQPTRGTLPNTNVRHFPKIYETPQNSRRLKDDEVAHWRPTDSWRFGTKI
jgi:hypothetical protein